MIGYDFFEACNVVWRYNQGSVMPLSPPSRFSDFTTADALRILGESNAALLRWESDFDRPEAGAWWHVIKDSPTGIEGLPKKTRYMVRRARKHFFTTKVDRSEVERFGYEVYRRAYSRYNTHEPILSETAFLKSVSTLPANTEFWAVYDRETESMVGFSENYIEGKVCFYVTMWVDPEALRRFAGYGLLYEMEAYYLIDKGFNYISDGARSISHETQIHDFLVRKFRFRKAYAKLNVVYAPWLKLALKAVFPFRHMVMRRNFTAIRKVQIAIKQEEIRRACETGHIK